MLLTRELVTTKKVLTYEEVEERVFLNCILKRVVLVIKERCHMKHHNQVLAYFILLFDCYDIFVCLLVVSALIVELIELNYGLQLAFTTEY